MAYQYRHTLLWKPRSTTHGYLCFELPALNALDEAIVQGRLDNVLRVELKIWLLKWHLFM